MTRNFFPHMSFRRAMMVALLVPMFVVVAVALWIMATLDADSMRRHLVDTAETTARVVGDYSSSDLAFGTRDESVGALALLGQDARVDAVALYDTHLELFSSWRRAEEPAVPIEAKLPGAVERAVTRSGDAAVEVWRPIAREGERLGTIYLRFATDDLSARRAAHLTTILLFGLLLVGLGFVFAAVAQRVVSRPILQLSSAALRIAESRDYSARVAPEGSRELRALTSSLNDMLSAIERHQRERDAAIAEVGRHAEMLEQRVHDRTGALEASNRELEAFSYSVSHDLRAPLRAIQGFGRLLLEEQGQHLDDEGRDFANRIVQAAERMDRLILDLLEYGRLGKKQPEIEDVDLDTAFEDARRQLADVLAERDTAVTVTSPLGHVRGHHATLVQAVSNLLSNAAKFVENGSKPVIQVRSRRDGGKVRLEVVDNGIGIAREHQDRVFQLFERLHDSSRFAGTGVGLAIVKRAIERMGGSVGLQSEPGHGSTFWIELPRA